MWHVTGCCTVQYNAGQLVSLAMTPSYCICSTDLGYERTRVWESFVVCGHKMLPSDIKNCTFVCLHIQQCWLDWSGKDNTFGHTHWFLRLFLNSIVRQLKETSDVHKTVAFKKWMWSQQWCCWNYMSMWNPPESRNQGFKVFNRATHCFLYLFSIAPRFISNAHVPIFISFGAGLVLSMGSAVI